MFIELMVTTGLLGIIPILILFALLGARLVKLFQNVPVNAASNPIESLDALLIGTVVIVSEMTTAGAAYYSWQMIGIVVLAVGLHTPLDAPQTDDSTECSLQEKDACRRWRTFKVECWSLSRTGNRSFSDDDGRVDSSGVGY